MRSNAPVRKIKNIGKMRWKKKMPSNAPDGKNLKKSKMWSITNNWNVRSNAPVEKKIERCEKCARSQISEKCAAMRPSEKFAKLEKCAWSTKNLKMCSNAPVGYKNSNLFLNKKKKVVRGLKLGVWNLIYFDFSVKIWKYQNDQQRAHRGKNLFMRLDLGVLNLINFYFSGKIEKYQNDQQRQHEGKSVFRGLSLGVWNLINFGFQ